MLPVVLGGDFEAYWGSTGTALAKAGMRAGLFHPTTGYSLPDAVRLACLIAAAPDGEACACDLIEPVNLTQPTVSHHMRQLLDAGLVTREQRGKWAYYQVINNTLRAIATALTPALPDR